MKTRVLKADGEGAEKAVAEAIKLLRAGDPVALPTETVYGLAACALNAAAVVKIFEAKARPRFDPLIVHLPEAEWLQRVTRVPVADAELVSALIAKFWAGPLTLVLPRLLIVPDIVTAGLDTVAVRLSAHPIFQRVVSGLEEPLAAPSANRFGHISPTTAEHVRSGLDGKVPLILDGGATVHGLESTIVAVRDGRIEVLRLGPITMEELAPFAEVQLAKVGDRPEAPGQLRSHYAPHTPLILTADLSTFRPPVGKKVGALTFRELQTGSFSEVRALSVSGDLREAAANLFRHLRELDGVGLDLIVAEELPEIGLGAAIMDRLRRAAASDLQL